MHVEIGSEASGPLRGIRVIDLSTIVSGPLCAQILGDLGADVIKVESPAGDTARYMGGQRAGDLTGFFAQMNRNKRSVVLDLKAPTGIEAFRRLASSADVLLENFRPDVMDRLGIGYEVLQTDNPRLLYAAINGFGSEGPYAEQPAYDMVIQALSGIAKTIGSADTPRLVMNLLADKTAALNAAYAVMAALFERERSGRGQRVEIRMLDAFGAFVHLDQIGAKAFGAPPGGSTAGELLFRAWQTRDGHVAVVIIEDHQWQALCRALDREDLVDDERFSSLFARIGHAAELLEVVSQEVCQRTTAELVRRAHAEGAPLAPIHDLEGFLDDPQVRHNEVVFELDQPGAGPVPVLANPAHYSRTPGGVRRAAPGLGEHTAEVLGEAGLSPAEIEALSRSSSG